MQWTAIKLHTTSLYRYNTYVHVANWRTMKCLENSIDDFLVSLLGYIHIHERITLYIFRKQFYFVWLWNMFGVGPNVKLIYAKDTKITTFVHWHS